MRRDGGGDEERVGGGGEGRGGREVRPSRRQGAGMSVCLLLFCLFAVLKNTESSQIADPLINLAEVGHKSLFACFFFPEGTPSHGVVHLLKTLHFPLQQQLPPGPLRGPSHQNSRPSVRPSSCPLASLWGRRVQQFAWTLGGWSHAQGGQRDTRRETGA